jgi:primase-polymerase (primpol)-like protein
MHSDKRQEAERGIPDELKALRQWVVWKYEARPGKDKPAKRPYTPRTGRPARTDVPATWGTWPQALARYWHGGWEGLGFVFSADDPYCGIDLDDCRELEKEEIAPWAWRVVEQMQSYTEISISGRGLHILVKAALPDHVGRKHAMVEVYDTRRYFAVTGERLEGTPAAIEERQAEVLALYATLAPEEPESLLRDTRPVLPLSRSDAEVLHMALAAANGAKFRALWNGDLRAYLDPLTGQPNASSADFALCLLLAYWTNGDADQMDRLFRQSALYRAKWDAQGSGGGHSYGRVTIWNAIRRHERLVAAAPARRKR